MTHAIRTIVERGKKVDNDPTVHYGLSPLQLGFKLQAKLESSTGEARAWSVLSLAAHLEVIFQKKERKSRAEELKG